MLCLFLLGIALMAPAATDSRAAGLAALDRKDYQQAKQIFSDLTATDASDYSAFFNLALAETALKEDEQASAHFHKVLELKPGLYEAELNLGILELRASIPPKRPRCYATPPSNVPLRRVRSAILATRCWHREIFRAPPTPIGRRWLRAQSSGRGTGIGPEPHAPSEARRGAHVTIARPWRSTPRSNRIFSKSPPPSRPPNKRMVPWRLLKEFPDDPSAREESAVYTWPPNVRPTPSRNSKPRLRFRPRPRIGFASLPPILRAAKATPLSPFWKRRWPATRTISTCGWRLGVFTEINGTISARL